MNNLSLFLYLADVASGLSALLLICGFAGLVACGFVFMGTSEYAKKEEVLAAKKFIKTIGIGAISALLISCLIPSKTTMYMIAASEIGDGVIDTPEFEKARAVINKYLDDAMKDGGES